MPTIEVSHRDLCRLTGRNISVRDLEERGILYVKGEIDESSGNELKIDIKDTNRPDLWSAEGIARELRGQYGTETGIPKYNIKKSGLVVRVDKKLRAVRPYTTCAVVRSLKITDDVLSQMIQLQEKVAGTYGRNRKEVAIGVYDLHKIKGPIDFTTVKPTGIRFVPLEFTRKMTPKEILEKHPKGREYGHLLRGFREYPIFIDSAGEVLSIPPIINSNHTGKVTKRTRDVFIECSGFNLKFLGPAINILVTALADRGGIIESVEVQYQDRKITTPDLEPKSISLDVDYCNRVSGLNLKPEEMCLLLERSRYQARNRKNVIELLYPAYRQDIMHQRDVIEDVIISYGYNDIDPEPPKLATVGKSREIESFVERVTDAVTGLGLQEIITYILTNKENIFRRMNIPDGRVVEIENYVSSNWNVFRTWLLPGTLEFLSRNKHNEYSQRVFEIGDTVKLDPSRETKTRDVRKLCAAITDTRVGYEEISSILDALMRNLGTKYTLEPTNHGSFIHGRCARIVSRGSRIGFIGEINPLVLENFGLEKPVIAFEMDLEKIFESL